MATTVPPPSTAGVLVLPIALSRQFTATTANAAAFKLPFPVKLCGVSATARASGGTSPTLTVDVKAGASSLLSAPVAVTAGTVAEGTVAGTGAVPDETVVSVDLAIGGTTPTWDDLTVLLTVARI